MKSRPVVFLDRDGVIIEDSHYVAFVGQVRLIPGSADAIARLNRAGWAVVVVTNQSGVARGLFTESDVAAVHAHIVKQLALAGAHIDAFYYCPHHPAAEREAYRVECLCRKPNPGMLQRAIEELHLEPRGAWIVGDRSTDLQAGAAVGARSILVRTGYGAMVALEAADQAAWNVHAVVADLAEAVENHIVTSMEKT